MATRASILEYGQSPKKGCKSFFDILKNLKLAVVEFASIQKDRLLLGAIGFQTYPIKN